MTTQTNVAVSRRHPILRTLGIILAAFVFLIVLLIIFWRWDWFVPTINRRMTAALHRPATISHLHVRLGFVTTVTVDDLDIKQPEGFEKEKKTSPAPNTSPCPPMSGGTSQATASRCP